MEFNLANSSIMESGPYNVDFYAIEVLQLFVIKDMRSTCVFIEFDNS